MNRLNKPWIKNTAKVAFVVALLYYLSQKGMLSARNTLGALAQWQYSVPAVLAMFFTAGLGVFRWQHLLRAQGIHLSWSRTTQLAFIGNFFNIALPGAISGDFVKAFYIGKEVSGHRARAFGSILFDRLAGLSALVLISAAAMVLGLAQFKHSALLAGTRVFLVGGASGMLLFYGYLFLVREHHDPVLKALNAIAPRIPKGHSLTQIYLGLRHYHHHRVVVVKALAVSVLTFLIVGLVCLAFLAALGETQIPLLAIYVAMPLGLLVTAVPVAPAGVGTGHAAFAFLFGLLGCQRGADLFTLMALTNVLVGATGGLVYLRFRSHEPAPQMDSGTATVR